MKFSSAIRHLSIPWLLGVLVNFATVVCIYPQTPIETAKQELPQLQRQLEAIDGRQRFELAKLDETAAKDEFETTQQFEARTAKRQAQWQELFERGELYDRVKSAESIYRQMNAILSREFHSNFRGALGTFDADKQQFPVYLYDGREESISVPLREARDLKENFSEAKLVGVVGLLMQDTNTPSEYLISGRIGFEESPFQL